MFTVQNNTLPSVHLAGSSSPLQKLDGADVVGSVVVGVMNTVVVLVLVSTQVLQVTGH
jgi:hypothetical protein